MSNSELVTYKKISPNKTSPRDHKIDRITIHCIVAQWTAKQGCDYFARPASMASANYVVGRDGSIGLCVEEKDRSWCSSSRSNDHRAITIETASDVLSPYAVTQKAYEALLDLVTDICRRNGKNRLLWFGDKDKSLSYSPKGNEMVLTVHRWFANKACPGEYLYSRHGEIAAEVTRRLAESNNGDDIMDISKMTDAEIKQLAIRLQYVLGAQEVGDNLAPGLQNAIATGITDGSRPGAWATRAEIAVMIWRALEAIQIYKMKMK